MTKVFIDAADKYIAAVIVYGKTSDSKLYVDAEYTTQAEEAAVADAFLKGVLVVKNSTKVFKPVKVDGNKVLTIDYSSSTVSATEWTAKAAE
jgi:hypothetical protein